MPPVGQWEALLEPEGILDALGGVHMTGDVAEFGCGYGTFTMPAARRASGIVHATDIDPSMVETTSARASREGIRNVVAERRDFVSAGCGRPDESVSYVMLFNILHIEDPVGLLREARRVMRPGGVLGAIHWRSDIETPRGPPLEIRPPPGQCRAWAEEAGLQWLKSPELPALSVALGNDVYAPPQASTSLFKVSGRKKKPMIKVAPAMMMGYQSP